jgi:hypothetical protein
LAPPNSWNEAAIKVLVALTTAYIPNSCGVSSRERTAVEATKKITAPYRSTAEKKIDRRTMCIIV